MTHIYTVYRQTLLLFGCHGDTDERYAVHRITNSGSVPRLVLTFEDTPCSNEKAHTDVESVT